MRLRHITEGVGLVVKGVNTTPDVGVDAIQKQAAKFGFKVDKKGKPAYTMHKKAHKNSDPNTLFNLGMAESRKEIWNEWKIMPQTIKPMGLIHKAGKGPNNRFDFKNKANNRANEDETKLSSASEIYVDMDGVLVDFFGPWTKMMGVDDWRQIKDVDAALQKIRDTKDFWINLKPTANADNLLSVIKEIKGEYNILSAPMADDPRVEPSKKEWVEKNLTAFPPKKVIITSAKSQYATQSDGTPNILIDDFGQNVSKWEASGGVGFKHKDHKFERTAKNLKQYFEKPATERELTKGEEKDKERFVKGMKKNKADFKKRYGKDADAVMYATATKMAKNEGDLIPNPKNSIVAKADTAYDFLKLGVNMANIKDVNPDDMNPDEPDVMVNFFGGEKEKEYMMSQLKRLGYKVQDNDGYTDAHYDEKPTKGKAPPQVKGEDVEDFITKKGNAPIDKLIPVQKDRKFKKLGKAMVRVLTDKMPAIIVDNQGHIINGHHRYDALRLLGVPTAKVSMIGGSLKEIMDLM